MPDMNYLLAGHFRRQVLWSYLLLHFTNARFRRCHLIIQPYVYILTYDREKDARDETAAARDVSIFLDETFAIPQFRHALLYHAYRHAFSFTTSLRVISLQLHRRFFSYFHFRDFHFTGEERKNIYKWISGRSAWSKAPLHLIRDYYCQERRFRYILLH